MFCYYCPVPGVYVDQHRAKDAFPSSCLEFHPLRARVLPQQPKWTEMEGNEAISPFGGAVVCSFFFSAGHSGKIL